MTAFYETFETPAGPFSIAVNDAGEVLATAFGDVERLRERFKCDSLVSDTNRTNSARLQIEQYFAGKRKDFTLPLAAHGTPFQQRVWTALCEIPYGETRTYGQLATSLGSGPRAVGGANGANPIALIVPCHRVIGSNGTLTGFAFGERVKRVLLELEGAEFVLSN